MVSTYSPSLRLELMATGDQSGTWGDTTNVNLGTLLEQAITGFLSVAEGNGTLTLTSLNGATDQARNMVIDLTGAMTGAHDVIVPTAEKVYLFKNSTTGGFNTTIKTAAGTGVAIVPGTSQWVYCDGTNVVAGLVNLQTLTASALSPTASDGLALGTTTAMWSDLFLASGGVINFNNGASSITHFTSTILINATGGLAPFSNDLGPLGNGAVSWGDLFLASGGVINWNNGNATLTHSAGRLTSSVPITATSFTPSSSVVPTNGVYLPAANTLGWAVNSAGEVQLTATALSPITTDGNALGTSALMWSDLFLASGSVINFNNGDATITHSADRLDFANATTGYYFDSQINITGAPGAGQPRFYLQGLTTAGLGMAVVGSGAGTYHAMSFVNASAVEVGSINFNSTTTTYATSSDGRLKKNFRDFDSGAIIDALKVGQFDWIADDTSSYGVIAQEAYTVFPQMITRGVAEDDLWGADYSKLAPVHHRELQSLRERVDDLENAILVLTQRIVTLESA